MSVKGEKYSSKGAMKKHESKEGMKERMMEYGPKGKASKKSAKKPAPASRKAAGMKTNRMKTGRGK